MADIELVIKIPKELYEAYKGRPPMLGDAGMDMIAQAIANGTPVKTVTNAEEAEAYPINQEENCNIVCDFIRDITGIDVRNLIKERKRMTPCDSCIENECEVNGYVCPLYKKYQESKEAENE